MNVAQEAQLMAALLSNLAMGIGKTGSPATAVAMMRRAQALNPFDAGHRCNLACTLIGYDDDEACALLDGVVSQFPDIAPAWQMKGVINTHRGKLDDAIECFHRSHALMPGSGQAKFDLASAYLRAGRWQEGWLWYEHRHEILPRTGPTPEAPKWNGEKTGHLAVWGDQGYGDRIMFARFLPWARERADKITFLTDPVSAPLLYGYKGPVVDDVFTFYAPDFKFDHQICLASLPMIYGATPDNLPPDPGLLQPAPSSDRLAIGGLKIGLVWAGNPDHPNDNIRSMQFVDLLPIASDPRNSLLSLQCGPPAAQLVQARAQRVVGDMTSMIDGEWAHAATVIQNLDLVVTVDTAVAHLAGALGVRCFLLVARLSDWRWLWDREDTPWYPTMRIFRQDRPHDWKGVVARVCAAIGELHQLNAMNAGLRQRLEIAEAHKPGTAADKEPDVAALMKKVLRPGDCFVDVGANIGMHTVPAAELVGPDGLVIAFEPGSNNLPALTEAVKHLDNVKVIAKPLWHTAEPVTFHLCAEGGGGDALWDPGDFPGNERSKAAPASSVMQATTLGTALLGWPIPRLIKIDTEGAEQRILEGALGLLSADPAWRRPPFIVAELHEFGLAKLDCSQRSLRGLMADLGYDTFIIWADGGKPSLVPRDQLLNHPFILNLLFSTAAEVDALWPGEVARKQGPMHVYRAGQDYLDMKASAA